MEEADRHETNIDFEEDDDIDFEENSGATDEIDYTFDDKYDDNPEVISDETQNEENPSEMDETPENLGAYRNEQHG